MRNSLFIIACTLFLTACGQKGPLYLPQQAIAAQPAMEQTAETSPATGASTKPSSDDKQQKVSADNSNSTE